MVLGPSSEIYNKVAAGMTDLTISTTASLEMHSLSMKIQSILSEQLYDIQPDINRKSSLEIEKHERRSNDKTPST
jgi:hypothetical protein